MSSWFKTFCHLQALHKAKSVHADDLWSVPRSNQEQVHLLFLSRPKQVHICTGVICLIYQLFAGGNFKQSAFCSNYSEKRMFSAQKRIRWIWQNTYIFLVEVQDLGYFELGTLWLYFCTSERFVIMFFEEQRAKQDQVGHFSRP